MTKRDEEYIKMATVVPDNDDYPQHRQSSMAASARVKPASAGVAAGKQAKTGLLWVMIILLLAAVLVLGGVSAILYRQMQEQNATMEAGYKSLVELESRVNTTGSSVAASKETLESKIDKLQGEVKTANGEIRKLWDLTNSRQKKEIADNKAALEKQLKEIAGLKKEIAGLKAASADVLKVNSDIANLQKTISQLMVSVDEQGEQLEDMRSQVSPDDIKNLLSQQESLSRRMSETEESVKSIDVFRRSVNNDISRIKQQMMGGAAAQ